MGLRREGRELALKLLYRQEVTGLLDGAIPELEDERGEALGFATQLVEGVREHLDSIDTAIARTSEHWDIGRMGAVDRTVLRIGVYEILYALGTPIGAIINEAVDCARKYSSDECGRFVNGILDRIAKESRPELMEDDAARNVEGDGEDEFDAASRSETTDNTEAADAGRTSENEGSDETDDRPDGT
jgi:N utilization substance protein B